jgi:hypothetical protein
MDDGIGMVTAQVLLDVVKEERLAENTKKAGETLYAGLESLAKKYPKVGVFSFKAQHRSICFFSHCALYNALTK